MVLPRSSSTASPWLERSHSTNYSRQWTPHKHRPPQAGWTQATTTRSKKAKVANDDTLASTNALGMALLTRVRSANPNLPNLARCCCAPYKQGLQFMRHNRGKTVPISNGCRRPIEQLLGRATLRGLPGWLPYEIKNIFHCEGNHCPRGHCQRLCRQSASVTWSFVMRVI